jgi:hypothetical protein
MKEVTAISAFTSFAIATTIKQRNDRIIPRFCSDDQIAAGGLGAFS